MKLHHTLVDYISARIVSGLVKEGLLESGDSPSASAAVANAVSEDLMVEDRLNEEVREMLRVRSDEMLRQGVQYQDMFKMIKSRLVRDRKLIL